jgi:NAD(P)-dependent dehydrogenase (short-subunit alcohol dehydrogenase family)
MNALRELFVRGRSSLIFAGRTAIVTGGGGALGSAYAIELAKRGCQVVVNDVGGSLTGVVDDSENPAARVVSHIVSNGGKAVVNYDSVLNAESIVETALKSFGSCDILINNAGILRDKSFAKMTKDDWDAVMGVHLEGTYSMCRAAWGHMQQKKFGRIINIGSGAGLYGNFGQANYSAAKMAIFGLSNTLAKEGASFNIMANCVVPVAESRMTETVLPPNLLSLLGPEHVVPIVTYLCHEDSTENGACYEVGGGWYSKVRFERSAGVRLGDESTVCSAEDIAASMQQIEDFSQGASYPSSLESLKNMAMLRSVSRLKDV